MAWPADLDAAVDAVKERAQAVRPVSPPHALERRARRQLNGSQTKGVLGVPYHIELFAHEIAHCLLLRKTWKQILHEGANKIIHDFLVDEGNKSVRDANEVQAAAATSLVLEMLCLPYSVMALVSATARAHRTWKTIAMFYPTLLVERENKNVQQVARQICNHLLKIKHGHKEQDELLF